MYHKWKESRYYLLIFNSKFIFDKECIMNKKRTISLLIFNPVFITYYLQINSSYINGQNGYFFRDFFSG